MIVVALDLLIGELIIEVDDIEFILEFGDEGGSDLVVDDIVPGELPPLGLLDFLDGESFVGVFFEQTSQKGLEFLRELGLHVHLVVADLLVELGVVVVVEGRSAL